VITLYAFLTGKVIMNELQQLEVLLDSLGGEKRIHYELEHFKEALKSVGNPEKAVKSILIGGTNGKGTTTLLISQALKTHGLKVGTYLSPHLQTPNERILHQLNPITIQELLALALEFETVAHRFALTYFEYLTLLFFVQSQRQKNDFSVVEVGLGGRLDSTNVTDPIATVLTNVSYDHQALLGNTLEAILTEKLGTLREESLLFTGVKETPLREMIESRCHELDAVFYYSSEIRTQQGKLSWAGQDCTLNGYPFFLTNPSPGTLANAALAFLTLRIIFPKISIPTLQEAFKNTVTPGRFEIVQTNPRVVLSGDHNPAGIECLKDTVNSVAQGKLFTICGFSPDKPYQAMYRELEKISDTLLLTQIPRLADKMPADYRSMGEFEPNPEIAVKRMLSLLKPEDTLLVSGSLYLVGDLRKIWKESVSF
jgi:dihydrofolate synthase / folylpolyglutamate synthase